MREDRSNAVTMKPTLHLTLTIAANLLITGSLRAQNRPASPTLAQQLQRLAATATEQIRTLPNFTCHETATSQLLQNQKVRSNVHVEGTIRVIRKPNGDFVETYTYKRPFHLLFIPTRLPYFVRGGFGSALNYFDPSAQACYRYTLSPGRIDFATRSGPVPGHICQDQGLKGFALLNSNGDITHIERTVPEAVARPLKLAPFAAIDLAPVTLNGRIYQLSHHMIATQPLGNETGHFEATYTDCKLFTATVTIGPATEVPATTAPQPN